jgi:amino acid permease
MIFATFFFTYGEVPNTETAVLTVTVAVGLQDRPSDAPKEGVWKSDYVLFANPSFTDAISAISTIIFSYAGTGAFFPIVSEMRDPGQYNKALFLCHSIVTIIYVTVGVVVYYYCGSYVASPALGSAGPLIKKVAYGIALPGLMMSAILLSHVSMTEILSW